jgi:hypothetical protein
MHTRVGRGVEPSQRLIVEIFQIPKMSARPEISAHIFHPVLDLAFGLWPIRLAGLRGKSSHIRKIQKASIPMQPPLQHHATPPHF